MKLYFILSSVLIVMLISCTGTTGPENYSAITGMIADQDGSPIAGAIMEISYYFDFYPAGNAETLFLPKNSMAAIMIRFSVPVEGHVKLWITRFKSVDTIAVLIDTVKAAGYHQVTFAWNNLRSDIYEYHIQTSSYYTFRAMILSCNDYSNFDETGDLDYYAKTDDNGRFEIDQNLLACRHDTLFAYYDENGQEIGKVGISRYIKLWALHDGYTPTFSDSIYADPVMGTQVNLQMHRK